jgi:hypothetical protein
MSENLLREMKRACERWDINARLYSVKEIFVQLKAFEAEVVKVASARGIMF